MKTCWFVVGPNGAGKSTLAKKYLPPECVEYVNFDEIANRLAVDGSAASGMAKAGRIALRRIDQLIAEGQSFAIETTLSGRGYLQRVERMKRDGWRVELHYIFIPSREFSAQRVHLRVENGGHGVPEADINRRYARSIHNVKEYSRLCDYTACYDNSNGEPHFVSILYGGGNPMVFDQAVYNMIYHCDESGNQSDIDGESKAALDVFTSSVREQLETYSEQDANVVVADDERKPVIKPARVVLDELSRKK